MFKPTLGPCGCKRGIQRDNCPQCEGTGQRLDFAAIRAASKQVASNLVDHPGARPEVVAEVHKLADLFGVPCPKVFVARNRLEAELFTPLRGPKDAQTACERADMPIRQYFGPEVSLAAVRHEFAHVLFKLHDHPAPYLKTPEDQRQMAHDAHGLAFYNRLKEVYAKLGLDMHTHDWETEYPHIRHWAREDGFYAGPVDKWERAWLDGKKDDDTMNAAQTLTPEEAEREHPDRVQG